MRRFLIEYESDQKIIGSQKHTAGNASTIAIAKMVIKNVRNVDKENSPHNFKVFDTFADADATTGFVPCVYAEE